MESGVGGSNGQHARQLVETAQKIEHVTVTTLPHSIGVSPVRDWRMTQHTALTKTVQVSNTN